MTDRHTCWVCGRVATAKRIDPELKQCRRPCFSRLRFGRHIPATLAKQFVSGWQPKR